MSLTVFTSIPPRAVRTDRVGRDVGDTYLARCVASWTAAGCRLVSLNGAEEAARVAVRHPTIEVRPIGRTAQERAGRPLVALADLLAAAAAESDALVGVINADLYLHAPDALRGFLAQADGRSVLYGSRLDVDDIDAPGVSRPYRAGLDCFFFAPAMVRDLPDEGFLLGETWWDYWLPVVLAKRGYRLVAAREPLVLHLSHDESTMAMRAPTYLDYFHAFARALIVRLPLSGDEPWSRQVRSLLAAFVRFYRPDAAPAEQAYLSQFLSLALSLYLAQDPELFASFSSVWLTVRERADDPQARAFTGALIDTATALAAAQPA